MIRIGPSSTFNGGLRFGSSIAQFVGFAMTITLSDGYASIDEANDVIGSVDPWASATDPAKAEALRNGRLYLDTNYSINFDQDAPPDVVKLANIRLAQASLGSSLFPVAANSSVRRKLVKAGPVATSTEFDPYSSKNPDRFPDVTAMMASIGCQFSRTVTKFISRA